MNRIFKIWINVKAIATIIFLGYCLYNFFIPTSRDEENELLAIELSIYTITAFLLIYCFFHMYPTMKYVMLFDIIFLIFIAYHFHVNYIVLIMDLVTIIFITLDNNTVKNFIKRRLRKMNIDLPLKSSRLANRS